MDRIYIRDLELKCIIGTRPEERARAQAVIVNLCLECDLATAGRTDSLDDTVNYNTLKEHVVAAVESSEFLLIERLANRLACLCLETDGVMQVTVTVDKPAALPESRSVAVEIQRKR